MPNYDYLCKDCGHIAEIMHMMSDESSRSCPKCDCPMEKQIGIGYLVTRGFKPTLADRNESEHHKKVKDKERAVRMRKRAFGHDAVGDPVDKSDPKHIIKGRTLGGQEKEVDKKEMIQALAKDPHSVQVALDSLKGES